MQPFCLENELYRLEFDAGNGSLCQLRDKTAQIDVIAEPRSKKDSRSPTGCAEDVVNEISVELILK